MTKRLRAVALILALAMAWYCGRVYERRQIIERVYDDARRR